MDGELSEEIIGAAYVVSNELGCGFLEKVYQNALAMELRRRGLKIYTECPIKVFYKGEIVGDYFADILVNESIIIELKACKALENIHSAQLLNYLNAAGLKIGLLINFGTPRVQIKRLVN